MHKIEREAKKVFSERIRQTINKDIEHIDGDVAKTIIIDQDSMEKITENLSSWFYDFMVDHTKCLYEIKKCIDNLDGKYGKRWVE